MCREPSARAASRRIPFARKIAEASQGARAHLPSSAPGCRCGGGQCLYQLLSPRVDRCRVLDGSPRPTARGRATALGRAPPRAFPGIAGHCPARPSRAAVRVAVPVDRLGPRTSCVAGCCGAVPCVLALRRSRRSRVVGSRPVPVRSLTRTLPRGAMLLYRGWRVARPRGMRHASSRRACC